MSQSRLALRAGVSRQLIGAAEAGRNVPRVDAAIALADALGVDVAQLFADEAPPTDVKSGGVPRDGTLVRAARVGDRIVTAPVESASGGWSVADGQIEHGTLAPFRRHADGLVVAGCEPGLEVMARMLREAGMGALWVMASSAAAIEALTARRVHAAVVHGPALGRYSSDLEVTRFQLSNWQVGLAAPDDAAPGWFEEAASGRVPVVQREQGAGVQKAFEDLAGGNVPGPRVGGHLEAAERAVLTGIPAVTIEPTALAVGAAFHPIDRHEVQIWIADRFIDESYVTEALHMMVSRPFQLRLQSVGGYDLSQVGALVS